MKQRYETGKIYQIVNDVNDQVYIGSTCMPLSKRLYSHKKDCENGCSQRQLFVMAREHGWSHFRIRLLESYPCDDNDQLRMREQHHIDELKSRSPELCLNMVNSYTSEAVRREQRRQERLRYVARIGQDEYKRRYTKHNQRPEVVAYKRKQAQSEHRREYERLRYRYMCGWGGDRKYHNNLLQIDPALFSE
jgi:group I intron endonuclease